MKLKILSACTILYLLSCKTYTVTPESFKKQLAATGVDQAKEVVVSTPFSLGPIRYRANQIKAIEVTDKQGHSLTIPNAPSLEMRVTHKNGKKYHFYFDTVILENDTLKGGRSRFIPDLSRSIPIDSIVYIELQEGGKKFSYQNS